MSSSWRRDADPLRSRQSRSSAVAGVAAGPEPHHAVPHWLVAQQQELIRNAGRQPPTAQGHTPAKRPGDKPPRRTPKNEHEDLIMVDLLDGAHIATRQLAQPNNMSSNSDSIISLPPIDDEAATKRWKALKAEAQENRRRQRGGVSIGGVAPSHIRTLRKQQPPLPVNAPHHAAGRDDVTIPILEPLSDDIEPNNVSHNRHVLRADIINKTKVYSDRKTTPKLPKEEIVDKEILPMLSHDFSAKKTHSRTDSHFSREGRGLFDDVWSVSASSRSNHSYREKRKRGRRKEHSFRPSIWNWRKPADEDAIMPGGAWIYLPLIGILTFLAAFCVNSVAHFLSAGCITKIAAWAEASFGGRARLSTLSGLRGIALVVSFLLVLFIAPDYSAGSGIPEMKCVLSGVLMPRMLNLRTLVGKTTGLIFALSSSISIGRLGPFIHMSGILAALVSKIPLFTSLHSSARFQLQALSAAIAAGVGATFGAPIGGTMLSIEIMSAYYYIHWLPMALYCSIMGYYCVVTIVQSDQTAFFSTSVNVNLELEPLQRLVTYIVLGMLCGVLGAALVQFTKRAFVFRRKHFTNSEPMKTALMLFLFAIAHTVVTEWAGGILALGQKDGVIQLINSTHDEAVWLSDSWKPFSYSNWNASATLLTAVAIKFVLTGLSLIMPVPAGTFMPIFEIGALFGRAFGEICTGFSYVNWVDARATAVIGAAAVTAGTLHTTSVAVVMLELTREAIDILPLTVGVIVSYAVSKHLCADLFSELIKIRRLPFILGLRERYPSENKQFFEDVSSVVAGTFMWTTFPFVTPQTTKAEIFQTLTRKCRPWSICAFLSDKEDKYLWGTIAQQTLWDILSDDASTLSGENAEDSSYGTFLQRSNRADSETETIPWLRDFKPSVGHPLIDMGPMQVSPYTPFWKVITFFRMLSMTQMYVVKDGAAVGCITRAHVIHYSHSIEDVGKRTRIRAREKELQKKKTDKELMEHLRLHPPNAHRLTSRPSASDLSGLAVSRSRSRQGSFSRPRR